jgi:hypothetical protein
MPAGNKESYASRRPHQLLRDATELSPPAEALLNRWRVGDNFSQPSPSVGPFTYSEHAMIFLSNAIRLCEDDGMSDFRVYGALYLLRHGLELMLKCWSRNVQIDEILCAIMRNGLSFDAICEQLWTQADERRKKTPILLHAVCAIRNHLQDGLRYPDVHKANIDERHANRALEYFRKNPALDRFYFAPMWPVASSGHKLPALWKESALIMDEFAEAAQRHAFEAGYPAPLTSSELEAIVELLAAMDDGGDGLRYPSSIFGAWYSEPPQLSLEALGDSAEGIKSTCQGFEDAREEAYSMSTFGSPTPK